MRCPVVGWLVRGGGVLFREGVIERSGLIGRLKILHSLNRRERLDGGFEGIGHICVNHCGICTAKTSTYIYNT